MAGVLRHRNTVYKITGLFVFVGLLTAILATPQYTANSKVVRESSAENGASFSGLAGLRGLGINIGGVTTGLTVDSYPDIIRSREVRLAIVRDTYRIAALNREMNLIDYYNRPTNVFIMIMDGIKAVTIDLPGKILRAAKRNGMSMAEDETQAPQSIITLEEKEAIDILSAVTSIRVPRNTAIMTITVTCPDPLLALNISQAYLTQFKLRVKEISSLRALENLKFIQERHQTTQQELELAEDDLAKFADANQNPTTSKLAIAVGRLERRVYLKSQLFQQIQTELFQAELNLERKRSIITVIEAPAMPVEPTAPRRKTIVLMSLLMGLIAGITITGNLDTWKKFRAKPEITELFPLNQAGMVPRGILKKLGHRVVSYLA